MGSYICVYGCICRCGHACAFGVLRSARAGLPVALTLILLTLWGCGGQGTVEPTFQVPPTRTRPLPTPLPTPAVLPTPDCNGTFFKETGHTVCQPFLKFWQDNGGLPVFGYPITEEAIEKNPVDGRAYTVQYFERARFELHPEQAGTSFEIQLGQLGKQLYAITYRK